MKPHRATIVWTHDGGDFLKRRYSRVHTVAFEHGLEVVGSAATSVVPKPFAIDEAVDPEAMLTASLSACHMLTFLDVAARAGFQISAYRDEAEGELGKLASGKYAVTRVVLRPADHLGRRQAPDFRGNGGPASQGPRRLLHLQLGDDGRGCGIG